MRKKSGHINIHLSTSIKQIYHNISTYQHQDPHQDPDVSKTWRSPAGSLGRLANRHLPQVGLEARRPTLSGRSNTEHTDSCFWAAKTLF